MSRQYSLNDEEPPNNIVGDHSLEHHQQYFASLTSSLSEDDSDFDGKLLHQACLWDNSELLSDLLFGDGEKNINTQDPNGRSPLHAAVISNSVRCARLLLMNGANPNLVQNRYNETHPCYKTCLHIAAERGSAEMVDALLEFGANFFTKDENGFTPMDLAEKEQHLEVVDMLRHSLVDREQQRQELYESLAIAVHSGQTQNVKKLLDRVKDFGLTGTDVEEEICTLVNSAPNGSNTLLFKACQEGHRDAVALLIDAGADGRQHPVTKYSPLYIASYHGRMEIVELLLEHFAELTAVYTVEHWLPIHAAAMNNHREILSLLLNYNYSITILRTFVCDCDSAKLNETDSANKNTHKQHTGSGSSATSLPTVSPSRKLVKKSSNFPPPKRFVYLMPFDVNAQDIAGQSVLYMATLLGNQALVELLLDFKVNAHPFESFETETEIHNRLVVGTELEWTFGRGRRESLMSPDSEISSISMEDDAESVDGGDAGSSSSSAEVTVISNLDKKRPVSSSQAVGTSGSRSLVQKLIDKLSPSSSPQQQPQQRPPSASDSLSAVSSVSSKKTPEPHSNLGKLLKTTTSPEVASGGTLFGSSFYTVSPFSPDLYCCYGVETSFHCGVRTKHYSIVALFLERGANCNLPINGQLPASSSQHSGPHPAIVTRVSHFNHNLFQPVARRFSITSMAASSAAAVAALSFSASNSAATNKLEHANESGDGCQTAEIDNRAPLLKSHESSGRRDSSSSFVGDAQFIEKHQQQQQNSRRSRRERWRSTALREAIRNRDKAMVNLLFRHGALDTIEDEEDDDDDDDGGGDDNEGEVGDSQSTHRMNALELSFANGDLHFVAKLLAIRAYADTESRVNKRAFDRALHHPGSTTASGVFGPTSGFKTGTGNNFVGNITMSALFPSTAVMVDWHKLKIRNLEQHITKQLVQWLIDSALVYNVKLKLEHQPSLTSSTGGSGLSTWSSALAAITRIDLSENELTSVPLCLFTQLPSLRILNLSKNRLQTLPETEHARIVDDCDQISLKRYGVGTQEDTEICHESDLNDSRKGRLFSRMRKSQSVTSSLSKGTSDSEHRRRKATAVGWNLPFLEELYLEDNNLECLPVSLFQQPEVKMIDLSNNKLRTLPPQFWYAPKLTELNLSMNLLCELPSPVSTLGDAEQSSSLRSRTASPATRMPKSISISSISDNMRRSGSAASIRSLDSLDDYLDPRPRRPNLKAFELNLQKPWTGQVNVNHDTLESDEDLHRKSTTGGSFTTVPSKPNSQCHLLQLNLSHNGFERVPFLLSCIANKLTHLNMSYNRIRSIFDHELFLGQYPVTIKHLDLSHNLIEDWILAQDSSSAKDAEMDDVFGSDEIRLCCHSEPKLCPYKKHIRLDQLKTLILTQNYLKTILITREELMDLIDRLNTAHKPVKVGSLTLSNFTESVFKKGFSRKFGLFGSQDDLLQAQESSPAHAQQQESSEMILSAKAIRFAKLFFPNISMIDLSGNKIVEIPKTIFYLAQLSVLNLSGNLELTTLPPEMGLLNKLWNLNTRGCINLSEPLRSMIISKTYKTADIVSYLNSILENSKPYCRMKLMLVGVQGIGKTSLMESLRAEGVGRRTKTPDHWGKRMGNRSMGMKTPKGVTMSTVGVDLCEWTYERKPLRGREVRERSLSRTRMPAFQAAPSHFSGVVNNEKIGPVTFRTWDFGGQQEYYGTHQYFLSKRSIYLVVWKITDGEKGVGALHQWLVNIQSRAPNSPVIIVGTHFDLVKEYFPPFFSSELQNLIRQKYMSDPLDADKRGLPRVVASVEVSAKSKFNIRLLANLIYETACELKIPGSKERILEQKVPATYLALEDIVVSLAYERHLAGLEPVLHGDQFRSEVVRSMKERQMSFRDLSELQQATKFLHENGVMLHYDDANLKDLYFLDPQWLADMLAHVVTIREINPFSKCGVMKMDNLMALFKNSISAPVDVKQFMLSLLNKFELALTWDTRTLLVPSLLPTEEQILAGFPGSEILLPLKSRVKIRFTDKSTSGLMKIDLRNVRYENSIRFYELNSVLAKNPELPEEEVEKFFQATIRATSGVRQPIHRLLLMSYVPCGFWSRLITRIVADEAVSDIVKSFWNGLSGAESNDLLAIFNSPECSSATWHCWQTGFGLRMFGTFLLRVKQIDCEEASADLKVLANKQNNPYDYRRMKFNINAQADTTSLHSSDAGDSSSSTTKWAEMSLPDQGSSLIEIFLPNQSVEFETSVPELDPDEGSESFDTLERRHVLEPNFQALTKLLVLIVEHIDTLLEDWYPALGTRFIHTSDGRFLVTRLVPCHGCLRSFQLDTLPSPADSREEKPKRIRPRVIKSPSTEGIDSNLADFYKQQVKRAELDAQRRAVEAAEEELPEAGHRGAKHESNDSAICVKTTESLTAEMGVEAGNDAEMLSMFYTVYAFMIEECILAVYENRKLECPIHGRLRMTHLAPDILFEDLPPSFCVDRERLRFGKLLGRGSFGFVFRAFMGSRRLSGNDLQPNRLVANSKFYLPLSEEQVSDGQDVAIKLLQPIKLENVSSGLKKPDMEAYNAMKSKWERDPLQYACKAYCTARTELNILATLKHPNIASVLGICPRPLALVLTLAPLGSLDVHVRQYRRSGTRIDVQILQQSYLQVSKALEYLHQHHIIYRDLKSENVLVWAFPSATISTPGPSLHRHGQSSGQQILLKLADYGISRSALPTGTKGFGGTEGFMAPEIMLYNGEEEYTEKVDCFSFAMFMYELATLRFPFEAHEFAIRENILDGIRPSLTQRDIDHLPEPFVDLMVRCWAQQPGDRPTVSQIVSIISAPEFCSLRDVTILPESFKVICVAGFESKNLETPESETKNLSLCLSRIGQQIDLLETKNRRWRPIGQTLECENILSRTVLAMCVVGDQIWFGDSLSRIHVHSLEDDFRLVCAIDLAQDQGQKSMAIKSLVACLPYVVISSEHLWLVSTRRLEELQNRSEKSCFTLDELCPTILDFNGLPIFCVSCVPFSPRSKLEVWFGQSEGKVAIVEVADPAHEDAFSNIEISCRAVLDHYDQKSIKRGLSTPLIGSEVPLQERSNCSLLATSSDRKFVASVLFNGAVVYQFDVAKRQIVGRLDCSKLVPCSESLITIGIEENFKPGCCQITAIAINGTEMYVGTNTGSIVVIETPTLTPITVFRPHSHEVKFIATLAKFQPPPPASLPSPLSHPSSKPTLEPQKSTDSNDSGKSPEKFKRSTLKNLDFWKPFGLKSPTKTPPKVPTKCLSEIVPNPSPEPAAISTHRQDRPLFVSIGRGHRNLLDRFIGNGTKTSQNLESEQNSLYAILWESYEWN